jgi:hypothetical protein
VINNSELRSLLQQDGTKLSDVELVEVKSLLIQLATIEYQSHVNRRESNESGSITNVRN